MRVLVLGSKGQLGRCLYDQLIKTNYEVVYTSRAEFNIGDLASLNENMSLIKPDMVINAGAYTAVDKAEDDPRAADLINHRAVAKLANVCKTLNAWLIHVSTDYVFDGTATKPYREDDKTNPQGVYGESKLNGELAIARSGCKHIIIRTAWVFSEYGNNFLKTILQLGADRDELNIVGDQIGCPTYAQDIAKAIVSMLPNLGLKTLTSGIFHYCGDQSCSWYDFAKEIISVAKGSNFSPSTRVKKIQAVEYPTKAFRPAYSVLDCSKIGADFLIHPSNWRNGIKLTIGRLNKPRIKI
jgi:dTDP-4-dehydrorhamnose reductase